MAEYIEREAAFDAVFGQFCASSDETEAALNAAIEEIRAIPAADVRPVVRGKWIVRDNPGTGWYRVNCSECGEDFTSVIPVIGFSQNAKPSWDFCPNCGADMREES